MNNIKHIVFDIGQVLLHWDPEVPYKALIPDQEERRWFLNEVCSPDWNREQDRGREWIDAENLLIKQHPDYAELIRAYRRDWITMLTHTIDDNIDLFEQVIAAGWDVTMLTNWHQDTYKEAGEIYKFLELPRGVTVSGEVKLIKPDPDIYNLHAQTFNLEPQSILFFDDSLKNVQTARDLGWVSELVSTPQVLKEDLIKHGIL